MTLANTIANDFAAFDGAVTVTLTPAGGAAVTVTGVTGSAVDARTLETLGQGYGMDAAYRNFSLPTMELGEVIPARGDTITDDGGRTWQVLSVARVTLGTRYLATCLDST